ncbi:hypothetical protein G8764_13610 [Pseudomaricurvus alcaniphilus]|uniref:hypothetical protein n=1 Tax=Pseudomaricurvus alcaniphilus TaxID=1166482 RepID=UPI001408D143|nr:hypothetical protein [Pseudomaricurvus alcaniphilus]NHN38340.1 hypothetical protein [Pseudomaricurvus alcaniphilus]
MFASQRHHSTATQGRSPAPKAPAPGKSPAGNHWSHLAAGERYQPVSISRTDGDLIQRQEDEEEQGFDYNLLPPRLGYRSGPFSASADTSQAALGYRTGFGALGLGYSYGNDIYGSASFGPGFRARLGFNPGSGVGSLQLGGKPGPFSYGLGANTTGALNASFGYGAPLLPMPNVFSSQAQAAGGALPGLVGAAPQFLNDPLAAYSANSEAIGSVGKFAGTAGKLYGQQQQGGGALPFGAGLQLGYDPQLGMSIFLGAQGSF